jgi:polysaccharide biosynthesis transport protein
MHELSPYFIDRLREHNGGLMQAPLGPKTDEQPGLREYWRVIRRHLTLIVTIALCCVLVVGVAVFVVTPKYTATSVILIQPQPPRILDMKQLAVEPLGGDQYDYYKTQYALLGSETLAAEVIHALNLQDNPYFNDANQTDGLVGDAWSGFNTWVGGLFSEENRAASTDPAQSSGVNPSLVNSYLGDLSIQPEFGTRLVKISFTTRDPKLSALVANAHVEAYVRQGMELRSKASEAARRFLEKKLIELGDRVEKSEAALNTYRHDKGIVEFNTNGKNEILLKRLEGLSDAFTQAETRRIGLEAQAKLIKKSDYDSLPGVVDSPMVQALKPKLATLEARYASMSSRYTLAYRPLLALKAKLDDTRTRLNETVAEIVQSVRLEYQASVAREKQLQWQVAQEKARALALNDASLKDAILARDVDTNRELYESVLKRMKEIGVVAEARATNVSVVDKAIPPTYPSSPRKRLAILLSAVLGLSGAIGLSFFIEYLDDALKTPEEVERYLRLPMLTLVPDMSGLRNGSHPSEVEVREGEPGLAPSPAKWQTVLPSEKSSREGMRKNRALAAAREAYRTIRSQILLSRAGEPPKTVLVTSAVPAEGKSITAVNTAITFAHKGRPILLIDADLRKARCHELLGCYRPLGLSEALTGQSSIDEVVTETGIKNLFFISAGASPPDPPELLGSSRMEDLLTELGARYDHIILDSCPVMPVSDSVLLSRHVDGVIVVAGRETSKHLVRRTCLLLSDTGAKILGLVLNQVGSDHASYYPYNGYRGYSYYSDEMSARDRRADGRGGIVFD